MHATTVKNKITQRDNYKEIMSVIVVVLLLTLTLIAIFSAIDQLGISEMGRIARDLTHFIINSLVQSIKLPNNVVMPVHLILFMRSANISATVRREFLRSTVVKVTRV